MSSEDEEIKPGERLVLSHGWYERDDYGVVEALVDFNMTKEGRLYCADHETGHGFSPQKFSTSSSNASA